MKSFVIVLISVFLLTACGQEWKVSTTEVVDKKTIESPIITEPKANEEEAPVIQKVEPVKVVVPEKEEPAATIAKTGFTASEVAEHGTANDCWLIIDRKVYEVTEFIPSHPGGKAILKGCGKDATQMFAEHPESAKTLKEKYYIGELK